MCMCMGNLLPSCTSIGMLIDLFERIFKILEKLSLFPEGFFFSFFFAYVLFWFLH